MLIWKSCQGAKFACPRVLEDQKMNEDNHKFEYGCPPDYQIFWRKNILKIIAHTNSLSFYSKALPFPTNISFWELKNNRILYGIKMSSDYQLLIRILLP